MKQQYQKSCTRETLNGQHIQSELDLIETTNPVKLNLDSQDTVVQLRYLNIHEKFTPWGQQQTRCDKQYTDKIVML